ncbi:MAG: dinitrogenase iron-molybdenum cofactor [Propionibacteriaceae bacterium]|jgi:predicted Fe-Mo cluster-binding NifX family protein|nr:dinitrogenase iron-molybdenum cofactor [Propionibacteriaceae bacterium]
MAHSEDSIGEDSIVVAVNLADGLVGGGWGRACAVAVASVVGGRIASWEEYEVGWDQSHDEDSHGGHHARIARFLRDHNINVVVTGHMGPPMRQMLADLDVTVVLGAAGPARAAAEAAAA